MEACRAEFLMASRRPSWDRLSVGEPSDGIPVRAEEGYSSSKLTNRIGPAKARGRQGARIVKETYDKVPPLLRPSRVVGHAGRSLHHANY